MFGSKKNFIVAILLVAILGTGLVFTISPDLNLRDTILKIVDLPQASIETEPEETAVPTETAETEPERDFVQTPIVLFDDDETTESTQPPAPMAPMVPGQNQLPIDFLE